MGLLDFPRRAPDEHPAAAKALDGPHREEPQAFAGTAAELARKIAHDVVRQLIALERVDLDYTPMSLATVEQILDRCSARGMRSASQNGLVLGLGCYFGEVVRRHSSNGKQGQWVFHKDTPLAQVPTYPPNYLHLMIPGPDGDQFINVFNKAVARLDGDRGASIQHYYKAISSQAFSRAGAARPERA